MVGRHEVVEPTDREQAFGERVGSTHGVDLPRSSGGTHRGRQGGRRREVFQQPVDFQATNLTLEAVNREENHAQFQVVNSLDHAKVPIFPLNLRVTGTDMEVTLIDPPGLGKLVSGLM
jgi:hypothetical protein